MTYYYSLDLMFILDFVYIKSLALSSQFLKMDSQELYN
jgi:hypothetical protein